MGMGGGPSDGRRKLTAHPLIGCKFLAAALEVGVRADLDTEVSSSCGSCLCLDDFSGPFGGRSALRRGGGYGAGGGHGGEGAEDEVGDLEMHF